MISHCLLFSQAFLQDLNATFGLLNWIGYWRKISIILIFWGRLWAKKSVEKKIVERKIRENLFCTKWCLQKSAMLQKITYMAWPRWQYFTYPHTFYAHLSICHTQTHTHTHSHSHTHTPTVRQKQTDSHTERHIHTFTLTHSLSNGHTHTHTLTFTQKQTHTHINSHTHSHTHSHRNTQLVS